MSASSKKKLRAEENAAKLTERQLAQNKEDKKTKAYTITFGVVLALLVVVAAAVGINRSIANSGTREKKTVALTLGDTTMSNAELSYYFIDTVNSFYSQNGSYLSLFGLDTGKALDQQVYNEETGETWADYFLSSAEESAKGVIACSAGNHAQGVALAATRRGIKSIVCMPDGAPIMKVENTKNLGAEVCLVPGTYDDAHDKAVELQEETGMTFIHPYDDEQVIAGQGTIGLEILDQLPDVDAVVVPVGGGGLISGVAFAIKSLRPEVKVYGVQAEGAPSMYRSLHEHKYQTLKAASTFADGIQVKTPGELTYQICEQYVDDIVTVTEDETAAAILSLMENQKLVAEGAGAVPVAAVLFHKLPVEGKKVACVVSGGNIDVNILNRVITRGLVMSGRKANMTIALEDKPGQLKKVAEIVSRCGSNVVSVQHDGSDPNMPISSCFLKLTLETRDAAQIEQIRAELAKEGFQLVSERV